MPLTPFQHRTLEVLATSSGPERYLAGGAALHRAPDSLRYSEDLDFFHDSEARVANAFAADRIALEAAGLSVHVEFSQPGMVRAIVSAGSDATRVDWAHDTAWRFFPLVRDALGGWLLHPVDLAINKLLALAGRDEPRDLVDMQWCDREILSLGALVWAAPGKDPGLSPLLLIELLQRRGTVRPEALARLAVREPLDPMVIRANWRSALERAEAFVRGRPLEEVGGLYINRQTGTAVTPLPDRSLEEQNLTVHFGAPAGVVPTLADSGLR